MKFINHYRNHIFALIISLFLFIYLFANYYKIIDVFNKTLPYIFSLPYLRSHSQVVNVVINSPNFYLSRSYIKNVVQNNQKEKLIFIEVPQTINLNLLNGSISIDDIIVQNINFIDPHIIFFRNNDDLFFIINDNYKDTVADIITLFQKND